MDTSTVVQSDLEAIIKGTDGITFEELVNDISELRKSEASAKEFSRTLKFNIVECKSKQIFLDALKHELDVNAMGVEFPSEEELKHQKAVAGDIQTEIQNLESKLMNNVKQLNEYKKILSKVQPVDSENTPPNPNAFNSKAEKKYTSMLSWYENVIKSIQVLSGINIKEYSLTDENLMLVVELKFRSSQSNGSNILQQKHTLKILFDKDTEVFTGAEVSRFSFLNIY